MHGSVERKVSSIADARVVHHRRHLVAGQCPMQFRRLPVCVRVEEKPHLAPFRAPFTHESASASPGSSTRTRLQRMHGAASRTMLLACVASARAYPQERSPALTQHFLDLPGKKDAKAMRHHARARLLHNHDHRSSFVDSKTEHAGSPEHAGEN